MKTLLILERKDLAKIRKARDLLANVICGQGDFADNVIEAKRMLDELLVEAEG